MGNKINFDENLDPNWKFSYENLGEFTYADMLASDQFLLMQWWGCTWPKYFNLKIKKNDLVDMATALNWINDSSINQKKDRDQMQIKYCQSRPSLQVGEAVLNNVWLFETDWCWCKFSWVVKPVLEAFYIRTLITYMHLTAFITTNHFLQSCSIAWCYFMMVMRKTGKMDTFEKSC